MKLRFYIALWAAKLTIPLLKITKHNGTDFPGALALKLCPDFLKYIDKPKEIITITGTDGKTTVTNMACDVIQQTGKKILTNRAGSNINSGISTILLKGVNLFNRCQYDMGILEVDERSSKLIYQHIRPDIILVINLFRDSIMRNAHPQYIGDFLKDYLPKSSKLIVNADDLISCSTVTSQDVKYFGIGRIPGDTEECVNRLNDIQICPVCAGKLKYSYRHYHHIGKAYCPDCGFRAPDYDYEGYQIDHERQIVKIRDAKGEGEYPIVSDSLFNIYNMVSVVALARELGLDHQDIARYMANVRITETRFNQTDVNGCIITMQMAKGVNALACSRVFDYISHLPGEKEIFLMNSSRTDEAHWSENPCWLYDADFEFLNNSSITHIVCTGARYLDDRLRLNLAGYPDSQIDCERDEIEAVKLLHLKKGTTVYEFYGADANGVDFAFKVRKVIIDRAKEVVK